jgi:hypothetical protein
MPRDPKASFKFTTIGSGAGSTTASTDKLSATYAVAATPSGVQVISDVLSFFTETLTDAPRLAAQADQPGPSGQSVILGTNGINQVMFCKTILRGVSTSGLTATSFQIVADSQPVVAFTGGGSANITGTFAAAFVANTPVQFISTGILPTELSYAATYYVVTGATTSLFQVSATPGGSAITINSTSSGVHQVVQVGVPAAATTQADRTLKNTVAITPVVSVPVTANYGVIRYPVIMTNGRAFQFQMTVTGSTASGSILIPMVGLVQSRDGSVVLPI